MSKWRFLEDFNLGPRDFFVVLILLFNTFGWLFLTHRIVYGLLNEFQASYLQNLVVWGVYDLAIIGSGIAGSLLSNKIRRSKFLYFWILLGTIVSLIPGLADILVHDFSLTWVLMISVLLGISSGLGMPSCLAYFADCTTFENRGRMAGIIFLVTNISSPFLVAMLGIDLMASSLISTIWRGLGFIPLPFLKPTDQSPVEERKRVSFSSIIRNRAFLFYLVPWLMFSLINGFEKSIFEHFLGVEVSDFISMAGAIVGTFSAFVAGLLCDWIGRKRIVIYGFISLGLAYAVIGIAPTLSISWGFHTVIDGIAWGVFMVAFVLILWGDLSSGSAGEKWYAIGGIPFFFADFSGVLFVPYVWVPLTAAFSIASVFLFVAVLPLMYAPETLPEKKIKLRQLRKYVEKARKVKEKHEEKGTKG